MTALLSAQYLLFYGPAYNCNALVVKFKLNGFYHFAFLTVMSCLITVFVFRNSQLSTLYSTVKSRTEMTIITSVRYQGNALTDTFNANGYSA